MNKYKYSDISLIYFIILLFLEIVFRLFLKIPIFGINILYVLLFNLGFATFLSIITKTNKKIINRVIFLVILFLLAVIYSVQLCLYKMFSFYFDWSLIGATSQVAAFAGDGAKVVVSNIFGIILFLLPFIFFAIFVKKINIKKEKMAKKGIKLVICIILYVLFILSLNIGKNEINSSYKLYYEKNNINLNIKNFGVINSFIIDTKRNVFGFNEKIDILTPPAIDPDGNIVIDPDNKEYGYNNLDIDFDNLINSEKNNTLKNMHEYFKNETGTKKNKYTEFFKDKNLILFMAESFNEIAVREDLTPTLYKLVNSGFVFKDFYTPTISSTIGGEFQELTGLVAASGFLAPWKSGENSYPMGIGKVFKDMGYNTFAYHDHYYTFQNRNKYLKSLGFDNFKGCYNGLEKSINCKLWPESDVEMINATYKDFIDSEKPFFTYYVTVSGHGDYGFNFSAMSKKHKDDVKGLDYSEKPLAYLAAQIELDRALETLIEKLKEAGKLDDTVIALVGDHYPYYLSINEVNEISSYKKDDVVEVNHSNFILWNNSMDTVNVSKVGSQIDVLPTIYNLFGVKYDSRLIIGKDILSTEPGLAIFGNSSWVSDKGTYYASKNKFVPKDGVEVTDEYIRYMNKLVSNKIVMSKYIMTNDYYGKVLGD